jgi:hypothetical protein
LIFNLIFDLTHYSVEEIKIFFSKKILKNNFRYSIQNNLFGHAIFSINRTFWPYTVLALYTTHGPGEVAFARPFQISGEFEERNI